MKLTTWKTRPPGNWGSAYCTTGWKSPWSFKGGLLPRSVWRWGQESLSSAVRQEGDRAVSGAETSAAALRDFWTRLWGSGERFLDAQRGNAPDDRVQVLIDLQVRHRQTWEEVALAWENLEVRMLQGSQAAFPVASIFGIHNPSGGQRPTCFGYGNRQHLGQPGGTQGPVGVDHQLAR